MPVLVSDPLPAEVQTLLDRRRAIGADTHDEVWEGVLHMAPAPQRRHAEIQWQIAHILQPLARLRELRGVGEFNLGKPDDYRVPDAGLLTPGSNSLYLPSANLVVEVISPGDMTFEKLPFYAAHAVDEVVIIDPDTESVQWLKLSADGYHPTQHSDQIELGPAQLAEQIDWPAADAEV